MFSHQEITITARVYHIDHEKHAAGQVISFNFPVPLLGDMNAVLN